MLDDGVVQQDWEGTASAVPQVNEQTGASAPEGREQVQQENETLIIPGRLRWLWLTLAIVVIDRASKAWFETQTYEGWHRELVHDFIYLVHSRNPGIAFGVLADSASPWTRVFLIGGSIIVIAALAWLFAAGHAGGTMTAAGLALLLGGAAGNVTDRIFHGAVTDFFEVRFGSYHYPAFNIADSAIAIGAALIILDVLFSSKHHAPEVSKPEAS